MSSVSQSYSVGGSSDAAVQLSVLQQLVRSRWWYAVLGHVDVQAWIDAWHWVAVVEEASSLWAVDSWLSADDRGLSPPLRFTHTPAAPLIGKPSWHSTLLVSAEHCVNGVVLCTQTAGQWTLHSASPLWLKRCHAQLHCFGKRRGGWAWSLRLDSAQC